MDDEVNKLYSTWAEKLLIWLIGISLQQVNVQKLYVDPLQELVDS